MAGQEIEAQEKEVSMWSRWVCMVGFDCSSGIWSGAGSVVSATHLGAWHGLEFSNRAQARQNDELQATE